MARAGPELESIPDRDERFRVAISPLIDVAVRVLRRLGVRGRGAELEDAVQTVLVSVDRRFDDLRDPSALRAYVCAACVNVARDVGRRRKREAARSGVSDDLEASPSEAPSPEDAVGHKEELALLQRLLSAMAEERREVFVLYEIEELTGPEIAEHLGIPLATVSSRLRRAREDFVSMVARMNATSERRKSGR